MTMNPDRKSLSEHIKKHLKYYRSTGNIKYKGKYCPVKLSITGSPYIEIKINIFNGKKYKETYKYKYYTNILIFELLDIDLADNTVVHINGNRTDNRYENLKILKSKDWNKFHSQLINENTHH